MKILFYRYGSICEPDIIDAFYELGHRVTEITEEITNKMFSFGESVKLVVQVLNTYPQDIIFTVNFFPQISEVCKIYKIPYISWIVDSPVMELFTKSIQNACNRIFLFDREQYREIAPLNPGHVFHYPLAANVDAKQEVIKSASNDLKSRFAADVSFVGSLYTEKLHYDRLKNAPEYLLGYLEGIMEAQLKIYGSYFVEELLTEDVIAMFKKHLPGFYQSPFESFLTDRTIMSQFYIGNKITAIERTRTLQILSEYFVTDLYTASDTSLLPKVNDRGTANSLTEMPIIFHESKINLNTTSKAIRSGIPLRGFDILACEGFMLSNYQTEMAEFFEPGVDFDYYGSMDEMIEKVDYYLHHDKERKEIAHNGFEKVQREYSYTKRVEQLLSIALNL